MRLPAGPERCTMLFSNLYQSARGGSPGDLVLSVRWNRVRVRHVHARSTVRPRNNRLHVIGGIV